MLTCGRLNELEQCINSLLYTLKDECVKELIILDNASDDNVIDYLFKLKHPKITIIKSPVNLGVAGGRNLLCKLATSDLICLLDSDVFITKKHWLSVLIEALTPGVGIVGDHGCNIKEDWSGIISHNHKEHEGEVEGVTGYCQLFRRAILEHCFIDTGFNVYGSEDTDFTLQIRAMGLNAVVVKCGMIHSWGRTNKTVEGVQRNWQYLKDKWIK